MTMQQINCLIQGNYPERCSIVIAQPVTLNKIKESFPFEGVFHFRVQVSGSHLGFSDEHVWLDLLDGEEEVSKDARYLSQLPSLELQASLVEDAGAKESYDYKEYISDVSMHIPFERPSSSGFGVQDSNTILAKNIGKVGKALHSWTEGVKNNPKFKENMSNIKSGATSIFKHVLATVDNFQQGGRHDAAYINSPVVSENLHSISQNLSETFEETKHAPLLVELWSILFLGKSFERNSTTWKSAGYQQTDPVLDFKATGVLSVYCLLYFGKLHPGKLKEIVDGNKANIKTNYPVAIVSIHITMLLAELFHIRDEKFLNVEANYWEMFYVETAFQDVFNAMFLHIDYTWRSRNAVRTEFGKIIGETKGLVEKILKKGPCSIDDFRYIAQNEDMHCFID